MKKRDASGANAQRQAYPVAVTRLLLKHAFQGGANELIRTDLRITADFIAVLAQPERKFVILRTP